MTKADWVHKARCATLFGGEARFVCDLEDGHAGPHEEYPKPAPPVAVGPNHCRENPGCTQHHGHGGDCTWPPAPAPASLRDKAIDAIIDYFATWDVEPAILAARAAVAARKEGK